ncbi:acyl-CoA thioesterase/bile acid-CoA:amino acid N-acyltransferase family protein [Kitasatospora sp. NPDC094015]|uniref:acyl-CoA thioesterase/bile acid-CoA:amino acid N-acyltransferase family protein n=1 Tax=Kitasatospora sp. NPDC094015 TaxID=3155205 RepID=UPI003333393E
MIEVDAASTLADQPVRLRITGLAPGEEVTVAATAADYRSVSWQSRAVFRADAHGVVAPDTTAPLSGTYQGVDGAGLLWSMNPPSGDPEQASFAPSLPQAKPSFQVRIEVSAHGKQLAARDVTRRLQADGVSYRELTTAADRVAGALFLPPPGTARHPAVLLFGGSEGDIGVDQVYAAALLASRGYPALALGYFHHAGLPDTLHDIPLEYFATAAGLLAAQPGADPAQLVAVGYSRGSEAALLLGQDRPDLVHGVIVYAPSAEVTPGMFPTGGDAWTLGGRPVPQGPVPLDRIGGPVLALAGAEDALWPSADSARRIGQALDAAHDSHPHQEIVYPAAGHGVGIVPYLAAGTRPFLPAADAHLQLGGTRAGNAAARVAGWQQVLDLLAGLEPGGGPGA